MKIKSKLKEQDLLRVLSTLQMGLRSGKDWVYVLRWLSENDPNETLRQRFIDFIQKIKICGIERSLQEQKSVENTIEWKMFYEILLQSQKGAQHLSELLCFFYQLVRRLEGLRNKQQSLLLVPKLQSFIFLSLSLVLALVLPLIFPRLFPSFIQLGRIDLFLEALFALLFGIGVLNWICSRPNRIYRPALHVTLFFYLMSLFIRCGLDYLSSWNKAVDSTEFSDSFKNKLRISNTKSDLFLNTIQSFQKRLSAPWPRVLLGMNWALSAGSELGEYLEKSALQEFENFIFQWEDELRRLTVISLFPLAFICFPAAFFLLIGPQIFMIFS